MHTEGPYWETDVQLINWPFLGTNSINCECLGMCALTERFGVQEPKKMRPLMRVGREPKQDITDWPLENIL